MKSRLAGVGQRGDQDDGSSNEENLEASFVRALDALSALDRKGVPTETDKALEPALSSLWERTLCKVPQFHRRDGRLLISRKDWDRWCEVLSRVAAPSLLKRNSSNVEGALACVFVECLRISAPKVPFDEGIFHQVLDLCVRVLCKLDGAADASLGKEASSTSIDSRTDVPAADEAAAAQIEPAWKTPPWSLRLLEQIAKTKVFTLATARQVAALVGCLMRAAHQLAMNYRSKMQIVEVVVSTIMEQAHESDPWNASTDTITQVIEPILAPLAAHIPASFHRKPCDHTENEAATMTSSWRFRARDIAEQIVQRAGDVLQGPVASYLREVPTEKRHALIETLYHVAPSVLQHALPTLGVESRANDAQTRLRSVQLIAKLFAEHFSNPSGYGILFQDPNTVDRSLFLDLLERFQDIDPVVRAGAVHAVHELVVQLCRYTEDVTPATKELILPSKETGSVPRPLPAQLLHDLDRHLQDRLLDQEEKVRLAAVQTVLGSDSQNVRTALQVASSLSLAGVAALSRVRDKRATVRNCTIQSLARLYRAFLRWTSEHQDSANYDVDDSNTSSHASIRAWILHVVRELLASYIQLTQVACTAAVPPEEMLASVVQIEALFYDPQVVSTDCLALWQLALHPPKTQCVHRSFGVHGWTAFPANDALRLMMRARVHFQNDMRALLDVRDALRKRRRLSEAALFQEARAILERLSGSLGSPAAICSSETDLPAVKLLADVMQLRDERIFQNMSSLLDGCGTSADQETGAIIQDTVARLATKHKAAAQWFQAVVLQRLVPTLGRQAEIHSLLQALLRQPEDEAASSVAAAIVLEAAACYGHIFHGSLLTLLLGAVPNPTALRVLASLGANLRDAEIEWRRDLAKCLTFYLMDQVDAHSGIRSLRGIKWASRTLSTVFGADTSISLWSDLIPALEERCLRVLVAQTSSSAACALAALAKITRYAPQVVPISTQVQVLDFCLHLLTERPPNIGEPLAIACIIAASSIILGGFLSRTDSVGSDPRIECTDVAVATPSTTLRAPETTANSSNPMSALKVTDPERVDRFLHAALMLVLQQGDWSAQRNSSSSTNGTATVPDSVLDSEPCARLRYYAAKSILKLARIRTVDDALLPAERHMVCLLMQDPIFEIRHDFARKLFHGLARGHLPWHWIAALVLAAIDPERENVMNARWYMTALIRQRRQLVRTLEQRALASPAETAVSYLALMPECALPYVLHLLAHHPDFLLDAKSAFADNKKYLGFFLDALLEQGQHVGILLQLLRLVSASAIPPPAPQHIGGHRDDPRPGHRRSSVIVSEPVSQDAHVAAKIMTERLHELAQLCTEVLKQKQAHKRWDLAEFPGPIRLPYPFFEPRRDAMLGGVPDMPAPPNVSSPATVDTAPSIVLGGNE
jgi:hypothetical protein